MKSSSIENMVLKPVFDKANHTEGVYISYPIDMGIAGLDDLYVIFSSLRHISLVDTEEAGDMVQDYIDRLKFIINTNQLAKSKQKSSRRKYLISVIFVDDVNFSAFFSLKSISKLNEFNSIAKSHKGILVPCGTIAVYPEESFSPVMKVFQGVMTKYANLSVVKAPNARFESNWPLILEKIKEIRAKAN